MIVTPRIVFRLVLIVLISVLLQIGFFSQVPLLGSVANLLPVVVVAIGLLGGAVTGAVTGFATGLLLDAMIGGTPGVASLALMAAGYLAHLSGGAVEVRSAGSEPAETVNPVAVEAMAEEGIDLSAQQPRVLTSEAVQASDVVVTMGCGDACPIFPGKRYENWELPDPAGQGLDAVRPIRDDIEERVHRLLADLNVPVTR